MKALAQPPCFFDAKQQPLGGRRLRFRLCFRLCNESRLALRGFPFAGGHDLLFPEGQYLRLSFAERFGKIIACHGLFCNRRRFFEDGRGRDPWSVTALEGDIIQLPLQPERIGKIKACLLRHRGKSFGVFRLQFARQQIMREAKGGMFLDKGFEPLPADVLQGRYLEKMLENRLHGLLHSVGSTSWRKAC